MRNRFPNNPFLTNNCDATANNQDIQEAMFAPNAPRSSEMFTTANESQPETAVSSSSLVNNSSEQRLRKLPKSWQTCMKKKQCESDEKTKQAAQTNQAPNLKFLRVIGNGAFGK